MNTEHYKAAAERTDADERALVPAFKRTSARIGRSGQYVPQVDGKDVSPTSFDEARALEIAEQEAARPAPNKAQPRKEDAATHSPDYIKCERCGSNIWATRIDHHLTWCPEPEDYDISKIIAERDSLKTHADKLAEALRDCVTTEGALAERSHEYALRRLASITATAREALAAYEAAQ